MKDKQLTAHKGWLGPDSHIIRFFQKGQSKKLTLIMRFFTHLGDGWFWVFVCFLGLAINFDTGMALIFSIVIQIAFQPVLKRIFSRTRPYIRHKDLTNLMLPPDRFSFPSGHTMAAFSITFVFLFYFPPLFVPMVIFSSIIGISRIYLGLHYPSDVLIGVVLGYISAWLGVQLSLVVYL